MLRLRPYKPCDADAVASWCKDERALRKWSSDRFGDFPLSGKDINEKYVGNNGDCEEADNFYPLTAFDETGVVGSLILRYTDEEKKTLRVGFVIVDDAKRGMGYGKEMMLLTEKYAFELFGAEKLTLGVFDSNPGAYHCYKAAGFREIEQEKPYEFEYSGETWRVIELEMSRADYDKRGEADEQGKGV